MALKVPDVGELELLDSLTAGVLNNAVLKAYQNDLTPDNNTVLGDLTECDFDGYAGITLNAWLMAATNVDGKAEVAEQTRTWTKAAGVNDNDLYGIFVVSATGELLYVERNPAGPVTIDTPGQQFSYLPKITLKSEV